LLAQEAPAPRDVSRVSDHAFRRAGVEPRISHRLLHPELVKNLVRTGWGVAPLPKMSTWPEALGGLVPIPFRERLEPDLLII
jgi:DNA-binding transcriptional LysR family regulator